MQANFLTWVNATNLKLEELRTAKSDFSKVEKAIELGNHVLSLITDEATTAPDDIVGENFIDLPNAERFDSWFRNHPDFAGPKSAFELLDGSEPRLQAKLYWLKKRSNALMAGAVHFTPNWEDAEWSRNENYKIGIDFFLSPDAKSFHIVLSNFGKLRVLELSQKLTNTDIEVLENWHNLSATNNLELLHSTIWDSFKLQSVNAKFYNGVADAFTELQEHLMKLGKPEQDAKMFASRLLGRLIFIWFIRKMDLISPKVDYFSPAGKDQGNYYRMSLERLFFRTLNCPIQDRATEHDGSVDLDTPYLNGGLFAPRRDDWVGESLSFPNEYFTRLFKHFGDFNFTTDESTPEYEQVAIDPEMLGRVFESLLASQIAATGEQARKAMGAFYTPREIVSYMCKESLRTYLHNVDESDQKYLVATNLLLDKSDQDWANDGSNSLRDIAPEIRVKISSALRSLKSLDPACGSGAFPLGLLQLLMQVHHRLDPRLDPYKLKLSILQENIFGSDIEPMAVEISRLRSWLSLIVEETDRKNTEPLPNLDFNFVCSNSLVRLLEMDLFTNSKIQIELDKLRNMYFAATDPAQKLEIQTKYSELSKPDFVDARSNQLRTFNPFDSEMVAEFFDPEVMFGIDQGFDIVIGNPPYGAKVASNEKEYFSKHYQCARTEKGLKGSTDTYVIFLEMGLRNLKRKGVLHYIVPISVISSDAISQAHKYFEDSCRTIKVASFSVRPKPVFENAMVNTAIVFLEKTDTPVEHRFSTKMYRKTEQISVSDILRDLKFQDVSGLTLKGRYPKISDETEKVILSKLLNISTKLETYVDPEGSPIYYRAAGGRYFKIVTPYPTNSSAEKALPIETKFALPIGAILSSSLFFWWYQVFSDNLNLKQYEITTFPIPLRGVSEEHLAFVREIYERYLLDVELNSSVRDATGYAHIDKFKEYKLGKSFNIIDEIDDAIGNFYGLSQQEIEFIKNYDRQFRTNDE